MAGLTLAKTIATPWQAINIIVVLLAWALALPIHLINNHFADTTASALVFTVARRTAFGTLCASLHDSIIIQPGSALRFSRFGYTKYVL